MNSKRTFCSLFFAALFLLAGCQNSSPKFSGLYQSVFNNTQMTLDFRENGKVYITTENSFISMAFKSQGFSNPRAHLDSNTYSFDGKNLFINGNDTPIEVGDGYIANGPIRFSKIQ